MYLTTLQKIRNELFFITILFFLTSCGQSLKSNDSENQKEKIETTTDIKLKELHDKFISEG